jgi:hypothetical protein
MSADLLAEFDSFYQAPSEQQTNTASTSNGLSLLGSTNPPIVPNSTITGASQWKNQPIQNPTDIWGSMIGAQASSISKFGQTDVNTSQDDGWGSFEAFPETTPKYAYQPGMFTPIAVTHAGGIEDTQVRQNAGVVRKSSPNLFSSNIHTLKTVSHVSTPISEEPNPQRISSTVNSPFDEVLFDAGDEMPGAFDDDDDFGDFQTVTSPAPETAPPPSTQSLGRLFGSTSTQPKDSNVPKARPASLLPAATLSQELASPSLTSPNPITPNLSSPAFNSEGLPYPHAPKSPSFQERNPFGQHMTLAINQVAAMKDAEKQTSASPVTVWPSLVTPQIKRDDKPYEDSPVVNNDEDEDWGDFNDMPSSDPPTKSGAKTKPISGIEADAWGWDEADGVTSKQAEALVTPPSNVPPPSILLTIFPSLFDLPQNSLFKGVINQPFTLKNRILSDPSTISFLRAYLLIATVAARIIAARKLRWKRDTILSQSMKIGQAAAGGKGGMKLAGVDKAEATREDREASEVVRVWKDQIGRLRSAIAVANTSIKNPSQHLHIPEITEVMHVKSEAGGLTAPKPCIICGLKREERISKVDIQVEDSFGEWWTEHWGHRACKNLWEEHESKLKHH